MLRALLLLSGLVGIAAIGCTLVAGIADYEKVQGDAGEVDGGGRKSRYVDEVLADAPIGYWRLDDAPGKGALDRTGKNPNGNYVAVVSLGAPGALSGDSDSAASFDGRDGLLSLGDRFDFPGMAPFSIELWANPASYNDATSLWTKGWADGSDKAQGHYLYLNRTGVGYVRNRDGEGEGISGTVPGLGTYSHIVVTFDGRTMAIYVNGTASAKPATQSLLDNPRSFDVGQLFQGAIDELAIYDHALTAERIGRHREVGTSP